MGNRLGWIIGLIFGLGVLGIGSLLVWSHYRTPTKPTRATTAVGRLSQQAPSVPVTAVLPAAPTGSGDAGDDYQKAFQAYVDNRAEIQRVTSRLGDLVAERFIPTPADLKILQPVTDALAAAAAQEKMTYSFRLTPKKIDISFDALEAGRFQDILDIPLFLFHHYRIEGKDSDPKAEKTLQVMFTIGWHMMNERARFLVVRRGFGIQKLACEGLERLYGLWGKPERAKAVKEYHQALQSVSGVYRGLNNKVFRRIAGDIGIRGPHPGDVINLAENHADPAVRCQATAMLGVVKMTCVTKGDKYTVAKLIEEKLHSDNPIIAEAARVAKAFDREMLREWAKP